VLDHLAPARRRVVVATAGLTAVALLTVAALVVVPRLGGSHVDPVAQDTQPPVLLVPGYGGGTAGLEVLATALRREGRDATIVHLAGDGTGDLNVQAGVVQDAVRRALAAGASSVDLVGYSAGGVTVRLWANRYDGGSVARRIVTLGSPHHGTELASLATELAPRSCPTACHQLATDSDLIRQLDHGDETPDGPAWVSIWTADDQISTPPETADLDGALDFAVQQICPGVEVTHGQLPQSRVVIAMVEDQLRRSPPALPDPTVCG
jgi:triacylglycerol esterase/lipase EstA (alpha/beta hydrolase family)